MNKLTKRQQLLWSAKIEEQYFYNLLGTLSLCALLTSLPSYDFLAYDRVIFFCLYAALKDEIVAYQGI